MVKKLNISDSISMKPFNFEFIGEKYIAVHQHGATSLFDLELNKIFEVPVYSNGKTDFIIELPDGDFCFFNKIYNSNGELTKKKFKTSKKSLEKYIPNKFIDASNSVIAGFPKAGIISVYDAELKPLREIQLDKFEILIHYNIFSKSAFTFNEKSGELSVYNYPEFALKQKFKVNKQNVRFEFSVDGAKVFNYGYKPQNQLIDILESDTKKVLFHPTSKKGYKEQYLGPHNFGTSYLVSDNTFKNIVATTHQNKAILYKTETDTLIDLEIHRHFEFDKFNIKLGKFHFGNVTFKSNHFMASVGNESTIWDYDGNLLEKKGNIGFLRKHQSGKFFTLQEDKLNEIEIL